MSSMRSFVINLDRSPERLAAFGEQARGAGLGVERIAAIDGSQLSTQDIARHMAPTFQFQPISRSELAVFLSHRKVWQKIVDDGLDLAAVFEDDAELAPDLGEVLDALPKDPPWQVLRLETTLRKVALGPARPLKGRYGYADLRSWHGGTAGYVMTKAAAAQLLAHTDPLADTVDQVMFHPFSLARRDLHIAQCVPAPVIQHDIRFRAATRPEMQSTVDRRRQRHQLFRYGAIGDLRRALRRVAETVQTVLTAPGLRPVVVGFSGSMPK